MIVFRFVVIHYFLFAQRYVSYIVKRQTRGKFLTRGACDVVLIIFVITNVDSVCRITFTITTIFIHQTNIFPKPRGAGVNAPPALTLNLILTFHTLRHFGSQIAPLGTCRYRRMAKCVRLAKGRTTCTTFVVEYILTYVC